MADSNDEDPPAASEEIWIKAHLEHSGTDGITRFCRDDFRVVSLTEAINAIQSGKMIRSKKCDGPGAICAFRHEDEGRTIEIEVFFIAGEMKLEFRGVSVEVTRESAA